MILYHKTDSLLVVTVAKEATDSYKRFIRSLDEYTISHETYGMGEWDESDSQKLRFLKDKLAKYKDDRTKLILVTNRYWH